MKICVLSDLHLFNKTANVEKVWLNSSLHPEDVGDWVWDLRVQEEKRQKEMESYWND